MKIVSDLTRDTRPTLVNLLVDSIQDTVDLDMRKPSTSGDLVEYENYTFYYRVVFLFMKRAVNYYLDEEIEEWCKRELLKETVLPIVEDYVKSIQ